MFDAVKIAEAASEVYQEVRKDENSRDCSWEHCYLAFAEARGNLSPDILDYLSLQLAFYLASWGMYRGSSFLLMKDYKVHKAIVSEILNSKYDCLLNLDYKNFDDVTWNKIHELNNTISSYYARIRSSVKGNVKSEVSQTLITKILLGTLGCVPAYDVYVKKALVLSTGNIPSDFGKTSIHALFSYYSEHEDTFEPCKEKMKVGNLDYPQMKFLDMGLWKLGKRL